MILPGDDPRSIAHAARVLRQGGLVGLPTETVYGLAANADDDRAVAAIYATKGRPADHPLIVHLAEGADPARYAAQISPAAQALMRAFWPGPLTLILPRRPGVAHAAAGGNASIGLRCPAHPVAQALLSALGGMALAAPSANRFGRVSPTTAQHVVDELGPGLCVLDGGACPVGIESTIVDCTRPLLQVLRPGMIGREALSAVCGPDLLLFPEHFTQFGPAPKASGTLESHYAPSARVRLMNSAALETALRERALPARCAIWHRSALDTPQPLPPGLQLARMPGDAAAAAQTLFATLRAFDQQGVTEIWVETPPADPAWDGVRDRLRRAAH